MRNFILFIRRFFNLILFLALEIVCVVLIVRTHSSTIQGDALLSSANTVVGYLYKKQSDMVYYFGLGQMNDSLIQENARLRAELWALRSIDTLRDTVVRRSFTQPEDSSHVVRFADYHYRPARVINNSVSAANNYITLNRGSRHGIRKNMAVISGTGVVGRVAFVSENFSSVLSVLNEKQQFSARLKDGTTTDVYWKQGNPDEMIMERVPQEIRVSHGDSVFSTTYSFFPPHVLIGTVKRITVNKKSNEQLLYLKPATNFRNIQYVYVVENTMADERRRLEDSTQRETRN